MWLVMSIVVPHEIIEEKMINRIVETGELIKPFTCEHVADHLGERKRA